MSVSTYSDGLCIVSCDGCGLTVILRNGWSGFLEFLNEESWITVPFDYGYGEGFEHFCDYECVDPPEWDDD